MIRLSIIIPTHNRKELLCILLQQIQQQTKVVSNIKIAIVVVVDGSTDGTIEMLQKDFPEVSIVLGDGSWWYTRCINEGVNYAKTHFGPDFYLLLNDDVRLGENYFYNIIKVSSGLDKGSIIGSLSVTKDSQLIMNSGVREIKQFGFRMDYYDPPFTDLKELGVINNRRTFFLAGRGMLIPEKVFQQLNGFDSFFIQYHSDGDFCLRAIKAGYKVFMSYRAIILCDYKRTASVSSFLNPGLRKTVNAFFDRYSRIHIGQKAKFLWRHGNPFFWPFNFLYFILATLKNGIVKKEK